MAVLPFSQRLTGCSLALVATVVLLTCVRHVAEGHVALTYPPARQYDLDFLDNSRTKGPCGMPKGEFFYIYVYYFVCSS